MDSVREICYKARQASYDLAMCDAQAKNRALQAIAPTRSICNRQAKSAARCRIVCV